MARLTSVTIRRFKRIEDLTLQLDDVTLLIGANNSGKSSILQAIHFAVSIAQTARFVGEGVSWGKDKFELVQSITCSILQSETCSHWRPAARSGASPKPN